MFGVDRLRLFEQRYGKLDGRLFADASAEKSAPLKYQEKKELIRAQRKAQEEAMGMSHAQAKAAAAAARDQPAGPGDSGDAADGDEAVVERTLQQIEAQRRAAEEAEAKRVQAERLNAVRERFQKGVRKAVRVGVTERSGGDATQGDDGHDAGIGMSDPRAAEAEEAKRERAKAKEEQARAKAQEEEERAKAKEEQESRRHTNGKSAGKYLAGGDDSDDDNGTGATRMDWRIPDAKARFRAGVNKVKAANAAAAVASRSATAAGDGANADDPRGADRARKSSKDRRGRARHSAQERENGARRHGKKSASRQKHGAHWHRQPATAQDAEPPEQHPFEVPAEHDDGQSDDAPEDADAAAGGDGDGYVRRTSSSSASSEDRDGGEKQPEPVLFTGELVMALP